MRSTRRVRPLRVNSAASEALACAAGYWARWRADPARRTSSAVAGVRPAGTFRFPELPARERTAREIYQNQIQAVAESDIWSVDYLALGIGMLLLSVGLLFLGRSFVGGRLQVWVKIAEYALFASAGLGVVLFAVDGISSNFFHDAFIAAPVG